MEKSIEVYLGARDQGAKPGVGSVLAALKACRNSRDLETGRRIHRDAGENGDLDEHLAIASSLIDMYAKCGSILEACCVFERIEKRRRDVVSWNCIIQGLALNDHGDLALEYFDRFIQDEGSCRPDHITFLAALKACSSIAGRSKMIRSIHALAARSGEESEVYLASSLTDSYAKSGSLVNAQLVFESMFPRTVVSWTAVILGFAEAGKADLAWEFYGAMRDEDCNPDRVTILAVLKACASLGFRKEPGKIFLDGKKKFLKRGKEVHGHAVKGGYEMEDFVGNTLVDTYSKCGSMEDARQVFETMRKPSVVSWSSLILGYAQCDQGELGLDLFSRMQAEHYEPNAVTCLAALKACVSLAEREVGEKKSPKKNKWLEIGRSIHSRAAANGFTSDLFVSNALVDMYGKCGSLVEAQAVFDNIKHRDSVSWTSIIQSSVQAGESEQALNLYARMREEGFAADAVTFVAVLRACSSLGALETGRQVHEEIRKAGLENNTIVWTSLIDFFGKCGRMVDAEEVFHSLPDNSTNLVAWSALIAGYSCQGDTDGVFDVFDRMRKQRLRPDDVIFLSILSACSHAGLVERGEYYFAIMSSEYGIAPSLQHYSCMVDLYGRTNQLDLAVAVARSMPVEPNAVIWTCLLDASQRWKNVEVAKLAFDSMLKLGSVSAPTLVAMANIYVAAGMSNEATRVRNMLHGYS